MGIAPALARVDWSETEPPKPPTIEDLGRCVRYVLQSLPGDILDNLDQLVKFYPSKDEARTYVSNLW